MSPRAQVKDASRAAAFPWPNAGSEPAPAAPAGHAPGSAPASAPPDPAEHQARLAALEREAFVKGYAQGEKAGIEAGAKRADAMLRRLGDTIEELAGLRRAILQQSERQLVQLALALARRIVRREIASDDEFLGAMARVALDRLGETGPATIRLHPDDYARTVTGRSDQWAAAHVTVVADPAISRGGCLVESPFGFVDASVDAQFQELTAALLDTDRPSLELDPHA
jgi:flagellar assembly protein FliH